MPYDADHYTEALECFQKLFETSKNAGERFLALAWRGLLLDLLGKREAAIEAYKAAQATGSQEVIRHDHQNWVQERLRLPFKR